MARAGRSVSASAALRQRAGSAGPLSPRPQPGDCSSAQATARHEDGSVESHGYEQPARRCCLVTDAGAGRATIPRRLTLAGRPGQERRSWRPTRSLAPEGGRCVMSRLSPPHRAFHRAGVAGHAASALPGKALVCRQSALRGSACGKPMLRIRSAALDEAAVPPVDGSLPLARLARGDDADEHADHQGEANVSAQYQRGHDRQ
jgi:hypothetical protein